MRKLKLELTAILTALSLATTLTGCAGNDYSVNKDYKADPIELDFTVDTFDPVYLEGFMYPYYYNMVDFTTEPETKNIVTETDFMGRYYPYSYALYEGDDAAQEFYRRVIDAVYSMEETIDCTDLNLSADTANTIFRQIVLEIPEFYYLDSTYNYKLTNNYTVSTVTLTYNLTREEVSAYNAVLYDVTQSVKSAVPRSISRYDLYV